MPAISRQRLLRLLFPAKPRSFVGQRWGNILLRSLHLVGIAGIAGGFLHGLPEVLWEGFWQLCLFSGVGLMLIYTAASAEWLLQLRGMTVLLKLILIVLATHWAELRVELFITVIVLSGLIAHAPGTVRGWQPWVLRSESERKDDTGSARP